MGAKGQDLLYLRNVWAGGSHPDGDGLDSWGTVGAQVWENIYERFRTEANLREPRRCFGLLRARFRLLRPARQHGVGSFSACGVMLLLLPCPLPYAYRDLAVRDRAPAVRCRTLPRRDCAPAAPWRIGLIIVPAWPRLAGLGCETRLLPPDAPGRIRPCLRRSIRGSRVTGRCRTQPGIAGRSAGPGAGRGKDHTTRTEAATLAARRSNRGGLVRGHTDRASQPLAAVLLARARGK